MQGLCLRLSAAVSVIRSAQSESMGDSKTALWTNLCRPEPPFPYFRAFGGVRRRLTTQCELLRLAEVNSSARKARFKQRSFIFLL